MVTEIFSLNYCFENEMSEKYISQEFGMPFIGLLDYILQIVGQNSSMCSGVGIVFCTIIDIISAAAFIME